MIDLLDKIGVHLKEGYGKCPICGNASSFRVRNYGYKCYSPGCQANPGGNFYMLLVLLGKAKTVAEAKQLLFPRPTARQLSRHAFLTTVLQHYREALTQNPDPVEEYLVQRQLPKDSLVGYAPPHDGGYLQSRGIRFYELKEHGLISSAGNELFKNRLVVPVYDPYTKLLVHFTARALGDQEPRWLSSGGPSYLPPISQILWGFPLDPSETTVVLGEGVSDGLSWRTLGIPSLATFGVSGLRLERYLPLLSSVRHIILSFDSDRYAHGTESYPLYKSWTPLLKELAVLSHLDVDIRVFRINKPGAKDVNDLLTQGILTPENAKEVVRKQSTRLVPFLIDEYADKPKYWQSLYGFYPLDPRRFETRLSKAAGISTEAIRHAATVLGFDPEPEF